MGVVANQICERAKAADLVMIGHRGVHERFSTGLLGSTAESVARKSPRPLFVSPKRLREIKRLALAYDGSERACQADASGGGVRDRTRRAADRDNRRARSQDGRAGDR